MEETFAMVFFRLYDRKIASGEITFSQSGISKDDFSRLCIDKTYVPSRDKIVRICAGMKLTEEESDRLLAFSEAETSQEE